MSVRITARSRLHFATLRLIDGIEHWDMVELPVIPESVDDEIYDVRMGDRIDLLAARKYGDPRLWWVVAAANDMELLPADLNIGDRIRLPPPSFVFGLYGK